MEIFLSRRQLLHRAVLLPLAAGAVTLAQGCTNPAPGCSDTDLLSVGEAHMRRTLEYLERTTDPARQCGGCEFFRGDNAGDCGHCQILNGAVSRQGSCNSWAGRN